MTANDPRFRCPKCQTEFSVDAPAVTRSHPPRWLTGLLLFGFFLVAVGIAAYRYKGYLITGWNLINDATDSPTLSAIALAVAALGALCAAGWLFLPFFLMGAYWDLRRRLGGATPCASVARHFPASQEPEKQPTSRTP